MTGASIRIDASFISQHLPVPGSGDDKYSRGCALLSTGSPTYPGAAVLGTMGAALVGAGLVRWVGAKDAQPLVMSRLPEVVPNFGYFHAGLIGSGWDPSMSAHAEIIARKSGEFGAPLVVDAGALPGLAEWAGMAPLVIATPHPGEAAKLYSLLLPQQAPSREQIEADVPGNARRLADLSGAIIVLKAAQTVVATPNGRLWQWQAPAAWGATAGAGDVLAGVITAQVAALRAGIQQPTQDEVAEATAAAVGLHGLAAGLASGVLAGDLTPTNLPGGPIVASDISNALPPAYRACLELHTTSRE